MLQSEDLPHDILFRLRSQGSQNRTLPPLLLGLPEPVVLGFYQAILPSIQNVFQALWVFNVPFTLVKGLICVAIAMPVYKPLTPFLKGRRDASK